VRRRWAEPDECDEKDRRARGALGPLVRAERLPDVRKAGWGVLPFPPDLAVEIFSPGNLRKLADFHHRVRDFIDAGVGELWVIYPDARYATVYRPDGSARVLRDRAALSAPRILPGFEIALDELWRSLLV